MKRYFLPIICICLVGCANEQKDEVNTTPYNPFTTTKVDDSGFLRQISNWKAASQSDCFDNYDLSSIFQIVAPESKTELEGYSVFYANEDRSVTRSPSNEDSALGFIVRDGKIVFTLICTIVDEADSRYMEYSNEAGELMARFRIDAEQQRLVPDNSPSTRAKLTGDAVLDCIEEAYTDHGWFSVFLWGASLFGPEAGIVVAATCVGTILALDESEVAAPDVVIPDVPDSDMAKPDETTHDN